MMMVVVVVVVHVDNQIYMLTRTRQGYANICNKNVHIAKVTVLKNNNFDNDNTFQRVMISKMNVTDIYVYIL